MMLMAISSTGQGWLAEGGRRGHTHAAQDTRDIAFHHSAHIGINITIPIVITISLIIIIIIIVIDIFPRYP